MVRLGSLIGGYELYLTSLDADALIATGFELSPNHLPRDGQCLLDLFWLSLMDADEPTALGEPSDPVLFFDWSFEPTYASALWLLG